MEAWQQPAIDYIRSWIEFQMRASQQPGCIIAIAHRGKVVAEYALGHANLETGEKLAPRHRFRIASHTKSFTAAGIMKLREQRKLRLDDPVGQHVKGLHRQVAETWRGRRKPWRPRWSESTAGADTKPADRRVSRHPNLPRCPSATACRHRAGTFRYSAMPGMNALTKILPN